jgi:hypothetical protein
MDNRSSPDLVNLDWKCNYLGLSNPERVVAFTGHRMVFSSGHCGCQCVVASGV